MKNEMQKKTYTYNNEIKMITIFGYSIPKLKKVYYYCCWGYIMLCMAWHDITILMDNV